MTPGWICAPGLRKLTPKLLGLDTMFGKTPTRPWRTAKAFWVLAGGVTAARMLPLVPKMVAFLPQSVKRQAQGSVSKPTKMTSSAFLPSFDASKRSQPERAGMQAMTQSFLRYGS
eukprot:CAMPEP_0183538910 /NCGR_PEP_ID=MMETSP0371-20130417/29905_1 /TAXON_ID=268820 /ORGANISM="Peridinium aciculiferum, Strain PAER-2" /LENGTH=114 /DNA_ID=CAMNT_0025739805 /DNA_START=74 /DNA_END=414 /DNA_ORIENTATION=-